MEIDKGLLLTLGGLLLSLAGGLIQNAQMKDDIRKEVANLKK